MHVDASSHSDFELKMRQAPLQNALKAVHKMWLDVLDEQLNRGDAKFDCYAVMSSIQEAAKTRMSVWEDKNIRRSPAALAKHDWFQCLLAFENSVEIQELFYNNFVQQLGAVIDANIPEDDRKYGNETTAFQRAFFRVKNQVRMKSRTNMVQLIADAMKRVRKVCK